MSGIPLSSLKHIQSFTFSLSPLSSSAGARSLRLLLSSIPSNLNPDKAASAGINKMPDVAVKTVPHGQDAKVEVVYASKEKLELTFGKESTMGIAELLRKVEAPAKALRLKEQGV